MLHVFIRAIDLFEALQEAARAAEAAKSIYKKALMNLIALITLSHSLSLSMSHEHAAVKMSSFKHSILIFHPILCLQCQCSAILCEAQDVLGQAGTWSQALLPLTSFCHLCPPGWRGGVSRIGCTSTYVHGRAPSPTICASNDI